MSDDMQHESAFDRIEADAVCEKCSEVNPPGTLLCKKCGNNLRDQRLERLAIETGADAAVDKAKPRRLLSGLLTVFGLLLILWTVNNVANGNIERWMTEGMTAQHDSATDPQYYWSRRSSAPFDELREQLRQNPISRREAGLAMETPAALGDLGGRYLIQRRGLRASQPIGEACARQDGNTVYFVAILYDFPDVEIRGQAESKGARTVESRLIGVQRRGGIDAAYGYADLDETGQLACFGATWAGSEQYEASILRVP